MANERRLKELAALAQITAAFQQPGFEQAQLTQRGEETDLEAALAVLGLMQQRAEAEQRAGQATEQNRLALRQLGIDESRAGREAEMFPLQKQTAQQALELNPRETAVKERQVGATEQQNVLAGRQLTQQGKTERQKRLIEWLELSQGLGATPESRQFMGQAVQGVPGFETIGPAVEGERTRAEAARQAELAKLGMAGGGPRPGTAPGGMNPWPASVIDVGGLGRSQAALRALQQYFTKPKSPEPQVLTRR